MYDSFVIIIIFQSIVHDPMLDKKYMGLHLQLQKVNKERNNWYIMRFYKNLVDKKENKKNA